MRPTLLRKVVEPILFHVLGFDSFAEQSWTHVSAVPNECEGRATVPGCEQSPVRHHERVTKYFVECSR